VEVKQELGNVMGNGEFGTTDFRALEALRTFETKIVTQAMMQRIISRHRLDTDGTFLPLREKPYAADEVIHALSTRVKAQLDKGTRVIDIEVKDSDPQRARDLALSFAEEAVALSKQESSQQAGAASTELKKALEIARADLTKAEAAVQKFRAEHPGVNLPDKPTDLKSSDAEEKIRALVQQQAQARQRTIELTNSLQRIKKLGEARLENLLEISEIAKNQDVQELQKLHAQHEAYFAQVDAVLLPKHPRHIQAKQQLEQVRSNLESAIYNAAAAVENDLNKSREDEVELENEMANAKAANNANLSIYNAFEPLRAEWVAQSEHYEALIKRQKEAAVSRDVSDSLLNISDTPVIASKPYWPSKKVVYGGSFLLGLALGVGLALLLQLLDNTFHTMERAEKELHLTGLAAVPVNPQKEKLLRLLTHPDVPVETAESFRALRTSLSLLGKGVSAKTYLFTSANAGEGKTYCAVNYAVALAQQGYRVLIIDADLRQPSLDGILLGKRNPVGLATHLHGETDKGEDKACNPTRIPNLYLFSAGISLESHPAELLSSQAFRQLLSDAGQWFHKIVIDTPPVNVITDALLLVREVDSVALVLAAGKTTRQQARSAISKLGIAGARPVGFVLNQTHKRALTQGYVGAYHNAAVVPLLAAPQTQMPTEAIPLPANQATPEQLS
jgi:capsular exopolysaccharide synthesis family protein